MDSVVMFCSYAEKYTAGGSRLVLPRDGDGMHPIPRVQGFVGEEILPHKWRKVWGRLFGLSR